jgi:hypothetical protein
MDYDIEKWIYENDQNNDIRYVLGTKGNNPLLCFGINPSTAKPEELDNTLKSVECLALSNGFDSWIMMNVYPQRATDPNNMHISFNSVIHLNNLEHIENILSNNNTTIWAAWGTLIEKRKYLVDCLLDIYELSKKYHCSWITIGNKSKKGHPHHPLYLSSTAVVENFNIEEYINGLKNTIA